MGQSAYTIRAATKDDVPVVLALRREAEQWLASRGIQQWTPDYADDVYPRWIAAVDRGIAWIIEDDAGNPVGHVTLDDRPDPDFWLPQDQPETALYLAKMIVARGYAGRGLGGAILDWATSRTGRAGKNWLRLECRRDNLKLQRYYLARGFEHVRTRRPPSRRTESGALFQRPTVRAETSARARDAAILVEAASG